jgi:hypothetical protein
MSESVELGNFEGLNLIEGRVEYLGAKQGLIPNIKSRR